MNAHADLQSKFEFACAMEVQLEAELFRAERHRELLLERLNAQRVLVAKLRKELREALVHVA